MAPLDGAVNRAGAFTRTRTLALADGVTSVRLFNTRPAALPLGRVVVVHGYGEHAGRYRRLAETLAAHGIAVTVMDLPGHGASEGVPGDLGCFRSLDQLITDACNVSTDWNGNVPLTLLGHSLGGLILTGYVSRNAPDAAIALSAPVLGRWSAIEAFRGVENIPPSMIRARHLSASPDFAREYDSDALVYRGPLRRRVLDEATAQLADLAKGALSSYRVLWMHGADDRIVHSGDILRALADLEPSDLIVRILPHARHEVLNDSRSVAAVELLREFVLAARTDNH